MPLLKSVNGWTYPGAFAGAVSVPELARVARRDGFEAIEPAVQDNSDLTPTTTETEAREMARIAREEGAPILTLASGLYWDHALGDADPESRKIADEQLRAMIRLAAWTGARTLLTIAAVVSAGWLPDRPRQRMDEVLARSKDGLAAIVPYAAEHGVRLGIENVHSGCLLTPTEMREYVASFASPWVGAYVDVGNGLLYAPSEDWLRILGPHLVGVHFKDYRKAAGQDAGFGPLLSGDVDWPEVIRALEETGYDGPVAVEMIPAPRFHPEANARLASLALDHILGR